MTKLNITETLLVQGTLVTLLTSFCGDSSEGCTDREPCRECIKMCNTYELKDHTWTNYRGQVDKGDL